jgi:hypothetical protein
MFSLASRDSGAIPAADQWFATMRKNAASMTAS